MNPVQIDRFLIFKFQQDKDADRFHSCLGHLWLHIVYVRMACAWKGYSNGFHSIEVSLHPFFNRIELNCHLSNFSTVYSLRSIDSRHVNCCSWQLSPITRCSRYFSHTIYSGSKRRCTWSIWQSLRTVHTICIDWSRGVTIWCHMNCFTRVDSLDYLRSKILYNLRWDWINDCPFCHYSWRVSIVALE